jgi:cytochrome b561
MRYSTVAISLHWTIAAAIAGQLATGLWMVRAIRLPGSQALAFQTYQWHKCLILILSVLRIGWRLANPPPPWPATMTGLERRAAKTLHGLFYLLTLTTPLAGGVIVSASPLGLPTLVFGLFEWPHIPWLAGRGGGVEGAFKTAHCAMGYAFVGLLALHVAAALKHHLIDRDDVLARMLPMVRRGFPSGPRSAGR